MRVRRPPCHRNANKPLPWQQGRLPRKNKALLGGGCALWMMRSSANLAPRSSASVRQYPWTYSCEIRATTGYHALYCWKHDTLQSYECRAWCSLDSRESLYSVIRPSDPPFPSRPAWAGACHPQHQDGNTPAFPNFRMGCSFLLVSTCHTPKSLCRSMPMKSFFEPHPPVGLPR